MIILASTSPRRKELLSKLTKDFVIQSPEVNEDEFRYFNKADLSRNLSKLKAYSIHKNADDCVIASDTVVIFNNEVFEKPTDKNDAIRMLNLLSNNTHIVLTSYTILYKDFEINKTVKTFVTFNNLTKENIAKYIDSNEWIAKAGGYGIQNEEYCLVKSIVGSYYNVMGFPVESIEKDLKSLLVI